MTRPGVDGRPLRVAIIGSGPAGFFVADHLLGREDLVVLVDMYEALPTPYGLVRFGVAPDHQKIKNVTRTFDKAAAHPHFRFFGNVEVGAVVTLDELRRHYHQVCFSTGAQTDRRLGIPGEDLRRSHPATEFVAWYNGHPAFQQREFDLAVERVAVVGVGNVAVDVARLLCRTPEELAKTDITAAAEAALGASRIREVYMLGRRGPAQAAFTTPEARELGEMPGADVWVPPPEAEPDPLSRAELEREENRAVLKKLEILRDFATRKPTGKLRRLTIRFLVSPVELMGNAAGEVVGMRLVRNELYADQNGALRSRPTNEVEDLPVQLVFRSVGYHGVPLPGLPFNERWGVVPNERGRVIDPGTSTPLLGIYVSGWIKRGPTGVIGTNKADAAETVEAMVQDLVAGRTLRPAAPEVEAAARLVRERQPRHVTYDDWRRLDEFEVGRGKAEGRPRVKLTSVEEMLAHLGRA